MSTIWLTLLWWWVPLQIQNRRHLFWRYRFWFARHYWKQQKLIQHLSHTLIHRWIFLCSNSYDIFSFTLMSAPFAGCVISSWLTIFSTKSQFMSFIIINRCFDNIVIDSFINFDINRSQSSNNYSSFIRDCCLSFLLFL
jgi:hypothetical protein